MLKILKIKGQEAGDYFNIVCEKCGQPTKNEYLGWDPSVPHFKATCEKCGTTGIRKLDSASWVGLPYKSHKKINK